MIIHYLKIAFRNLLKYKTQNVISIIGLAIGFTCFVLANLWIQYEMTYDAQHDGADRIYILYKKNPMSDSGYNIHFAYPISTILKNEFPEVEAVCAFSRWKDFELEVDGKPTMNTHILEADSCFMNMFGVSVLSGNMDFMYSDEKVALTTKMAMQMFDTTDILGKEVKSNGKYRTVCAILSDLPHSNLSFGYWGEGAYYHKWQEWFNLGFQICVKLQKGVSLKAFQQKLAGYQKKADPRDKETIFNDIQLMPITKYHYSNLNEEKAIKFNYLILFSMTGGLVILCSLFNYLALFTTRIKMRSKELELRKVCGSSIGSLFLLLGTEYSLMLLMSGLLGITLVEIVLPIFKAMSGVAGHIYGQSLLYFTGIFILSLILLIPFVFRHNLSPKSGNRFALRRYSLIFQLVISTIFIFCMVVIMKQLHHLSHTDLGWERKNIAVFALLYPRDSFDEIADKTAQMSCTREVLKGSFGLLPRGASMNLQIEDWDGKQHGTEGTDMLSLLEGERLVRFYNLKLLKGEMLKADDVNKVMINETAAKTFGMNDPIGKNLYLSSKDKKTMTIVGLIKDFHTTAPTVPTQPIMLIGERGLGFDFGEGQILVKYHEGKWKELKSKVDSMFTKSYSGTRYRLLNVEDVYAEYLTSETTLLKLLSLISVVCISISIFGIFSLVTLSCEQRQKEIAVRKVNGATIKDILIMFIKDYMLILLVSSAIAFPIGYILMKRWLQSYIEQINISIWFYLVIFISLAIVIMLCIGWRVWNAARQNPAEVIKSE